MSLFDRFADGDEPDLWTGGAMFVLLDEPAQWVHRRVESVTFLDAVSIRRRVSIDFDVPSEGLVPEEGSPLVPLAWLEKEPLVDLDVSDEAGSSLPVLTRKENAFVSWSLLARLGQEVLRAHMGRPVDVPPSILHDLKEIASGPASAAMSRVGSLRAGSDSGFRAALSDTPLFVEFATNLAQRFLLLVELRQVDAGIRRLVKFSYTQPLEPAEGESRDRLMGMLGWRPTQFDVLAPAVGEGQSHHFEFVAPPGLQVEEAVLFVATETKDDLGRDYVGQVVGPRAHMYASDELPEAAGVASVWLGSPKSGLLRASVATAALTLGVLVFFLWGKRLQSVGDSVTVALLLAVPGLIAGFIARPGEHRMATDLLAGIRGAISLCGLNGVFGRRYPRGRSPWHGLDGHVDGSCICHRSLLNFSYSGLSGIKPLIASMKGVGMAKKAGKHAKASSRGGAYVIRSAEGNRTVVRGSKSGKSQGIRSAIRNGQAKPSTSPS